MIRYSIAAAVALSFAACSSSDPAPAPEPGPTSSSGSSGTTSSSSSGGSSGSTSGAPAPAAPKAPTLKQLAKMAGGLHVMWTNEDKACDAIIGERKTAKEEYSVVFTVPGEADNKHDGAATGAIEYTYRLRCKKGDVLSAYSNEMSASPQ